MKQRYILVLGQTIAEGNTYAKRAGLPRFTYRSVGSASSIRGIQSADVHILPNFSKRLDRHAVLATLRWGRDIKLIDVEMPAPLEAPPVDQGDGMGEQLTIDDLPVPNDVSNALETTYAAVAERANLPSQAEVVEYVPGGETLDLPADLEGFLEPEGWEPPKALDAEQVLALAAAPDESGAKVLDRVASMQDMADDLDEEQGGDETGETEPSEDPAPTEEPKPTRRRRTRCADCNELKPLEGEHECAASAPVRPAEPAADGWWS